MFKPSYDWGLVTIVVCVLIFWLIVSWLAIESYGWLT